MWVSYMVLLPVLWPHEVGEGPAGCSGRSSWERAPPVKQLARHMAVKLFANEVPDVNLETAEGRRFNFKSS